jgi:hypothetical protein
MRRTPALITLLLVLALASTASAAAAAPPVAGPTVDGKRASLAALRGKPVIVNVWSSW